MLQNPETDSFAVPCLAAVLYFIILVTKFIFLLTDIYPLSNFPQGGKAPALQSGSLAKLAHWASSLPSAHFPRALLRRSDFAKAQGEGWKGVLSF
jgi:hypothetical protein